MNQNRFQFGKHCRWCGKAYLAVKPIGGDGFCSPACKQAHHRAYHKYVTTKKDHSSIILRSQKSGNAKKKPSAIGKKR